MGYEPGPRLKIQLFGPFSVRIENRLLPPLRTRKVAWLLALLILRCPKPVDRGWLAATLWPDSDHAEALRNLRGSLYDLRKALGAETKRFSSPTPASLAIDLSGAEVDLITFDAGIESGDTTALNRAVGLYQGELLEGCQEEWIFPERDRRMTRCLDALETLAQMERRDGRLTVALQRLRHAVSLDPLRETAQRALIGALADAGDFAGATQAYRDFRLRLHTDLQSSPGADTTALYEQIRVRARHEHALPAQTAVRSSPGSADSSTMPVMQRVLPAPQPSHNLPRAVTSFIAREREIEQVCALLQNAPLLTLTGSGGSGKTRLALQIAAELRRNYPDGVWLVELASLSDPLLVSQAVASIFSVREQPGTPLLQTVCEALASRHLLLVLDNCEHLLSECARLASALLRACPEVSLLATSRERLRIAGEQTYRVPSLALPDLTQSATAESIAQVEAIRLFVERARLTNSAFVVTNRNAPSLVALCHRLDGIPLALELAAARVCSLSIEEMVSRLEGQFDLLTGGDRAALPRHQTLRALIDWSYDLLSPHEKLLLQRLSVFSGGWTLDAAERVGAGQSVEKWQVLDLLTSLVDKSLVLAEERVGSVRYRMFDTLRQYAAEKLQESGNSDAVLMRRCDWFLDLARQADEASRVGMNQAAWLKRLETEHDNLRATLDWPGGGGEGAQAGLELAASLWRFWSVHGHVREGREHLRQVLNREGAQAGTAARSRALNAAGNLADNQGDFTAAAGFYQEALTIRKGLAESGHDPNDLRGAADYSCSLGHVSRKRGDPEAAGTWYQQSRELHEKLLARRRERGDRREIADSLTELGLVCTQLGAYAEAWAFHAESLSLQREAADSLKIGATLIYLGDVALQIENFVGAQAFYTEGLSLKSAMGDRRGAALANAKLGELASQLGDYAAARAFYETGWSLFSILGDRQHLALCLEGLAVVSLAQGEARQAVQQWGTAAALRLSTGTPVPFHQQEEINISLNKAREILGEEDFALAWTDGQNLSLNRLHNPAPDPTE